MPPARKRPGRLDEETAATIAAPAQKSGQKAKASAKSTTEAIASTEADAPKLTPDGRPLAKVSVNIAELIPVGQFANVALGPFNATLWVDLDDDTPVSDAQLANLAKAGNQLADTMMRDVLSVQRNIVLEVLAEQAKEEASD